jgi:hypothetical protein
MITETAYGTIDLPKTVTEMVKHIEALEKKVFATPAPAPAAVVPPPHPPAPVPVPVAAPVEAPK